MDAPRPPFKSLLCIGGYRSGAMFPIVFGRTRSECERLLPKALEAMPHRVRHVEPVSWFHWEQLDERTGRWVWEREVGLYRLGIRRDRSL